MPVEKGVSGNSNTLSKAMQTTLLLSYFHWLIRTGQFVVLYPTLEEMYQNE